MVAAYGAWYLYTYIVRTQHPIKVGILHSLTGAMANNEKNLIDIELMAIDEINSAGGLLGRKLITIVADGQSNEFQFAEQAERLITQEKVDVIIGCWTSASRKAVKDIVEKHDSLLLYPVQYEGVEESQHIFYLGATPNQQIIPAATWCFDNLGKRFFLIGSDYVFPRIAHRILQQHIASLGGETVGEAFVKLGAPITLDLIQKIVQSKPDVICNSINGISNVSFFKELFAAGITPEKIPTMSFSLGEPEIASLERSSIIGAYCASTYYQHLSNETNRELIKNFKQRYGENRSIGDAMQAAYSLLNMWANAVKTTESTAPDSVIKALKKEVYHSPAGLIYFDSNHHIWQSAFIVKVNFEGKFVPVWNSGQQQLRPEPFSHYLSKNEWLDLLKQLYEGWGKRWSVA